MSQFDDYSASDLLVCPTCKATFEPTDAGRAGMREHRCVPDRHGASDDPAHQAVDGGFVCQNCGTTRSTPLGISRHRSTCTGDQR